MIEAFNGYCVLFTILFTFIFVFLQECAIDKVFSLISGPKCTKCAKWLNNTLYRYSLSTEESNFKCLRIALAVLFLLFPFFTLAFGYNLTGYYIFAIIIIALILASPHLLEFTWKHLFWLSPTEILIISVLTALNIYYHKPGYLLNPGLLQENEVAQFLVPLFMAVLLIKGISLCVFFILNSLLTCSKYFTKILLKHNNPSKYIAKYTLTVSSSYLLTLLGTKLIVWGKIAIIDAFNYFTHTYLML